ncbi:MAG TPA: alkaline phosphatase family protein [Candidatus Tumulicola sp.]|nr:alkaline phosphatase family protein [Candidatus Tumulicola sp.]
MGAAIALSACGGPGQRSTLPAMGYGHVLRGAGSNPIQHVVIIMQENRSFDNFFYDFPGANGATYGYGHGVKHTLQPHDLTLPQDPIHSHWQFLEDWDNGKNDGWDRQVKGFDTTRRGCHVEPEDFPRCWVYNKGSFWNQIAFTYVPENQIQPYWDMASQYTLGDDTFSSNNGESFPSHEYMIAGQSGHATEAPSTNAAWGCDAPSEWEYYLAFGQSKPPVWSPKIGHEWGYRTGPDPCFPLDASPSVPYPTIADLLDRAGVSWRYYVQPNRRTKNFGYDSWWLNAFDAVKSVRHGPDWQKDISMPDTNILGDIGKGHLQQVSWVMPHKGASDHAGGGSGPCGPNWVASIVNAIGRSPYWKNTAIIIMWDEWGGFFDHVIPPQYADPATGAYEGLGYRVPLIVVSPYAKPHYISHKQHEVASTLHYIEDTFNLPFLSSLAGPSYHYADQRADGFDDVFDYTQQPIAFKPIKLVPNLPYHCKSAPDFEEHQFGPEEDY